MIVLDTVPGAHGCSHVQVSRTLTELIPVFYVHLGA
jgi:hypothetical protein